MSGQDSSTQSHHAGLKGIKAETYLNCLLAGVDANPIAVKVKEIHSREVRFSASQKMSKGTAVEMEFHCPKHRLKSSFHGTIVTDQSNPNAGRFYATVHFTEADRTSWLQWLKALSDLEIQQSRAGAQEKFQEAKKWEEAKDWGKMLRALQQARSIDPEIEGLTELEEKATALLRKERARQAKLAGIAVLAILSVFVSIFWRYRQRRVEFANALLEARKAREKNDHQKAYEWVEAALRYRPDDPAVLEWARKELIPRGYEQAFILPTAARDSMGNPVQRGRDPKTSFPLEVVHKATGLHFVFLPPGLFHMGSPENEEFRESSEEHHPVTLTRPFYMSKYEVTVGMFRTFVEGSKYQTEAETNGGGWVLTPEGVSQRAEATWKNPGFLQSDDLPVVQVSWKDAQKFLRWLDGGQGKLFRLPTEAEWEYGCRAGRESRFTWGEQARYSRYNANLADLKLRQLLPQLEVFEVEDGFLYTSPVGKFVPNDFGLYNMIGNVWEWCSDWYDPHYYGTSPSADPAGPSTGYRKVLRGGSWASGPRQSRCASRREAEPEFRGHDVGFRVVVAPSR
ncbi:MAG: SUMF1/EgtB/PvdO family nonheme iron enzyme [Planctomycetes bacterium]|nr:SUMF1/EgtB/PvdO family nonheme iron enzyme [Planctomycetota bacterium]